MSRIEQLVGAHLHLLEKTLIEEMQQSVFVGKSPIERADSHSRTLHDLGERRFGEALLLEYSLGSVENPVERLLTARLLRRSESRNCHRTSLASTGDRCAAIDRDVR